jgi:hypothetical protein
MFKQARIEGNKENIYSVSVIHWIGLTTQDYLKFVKATTCMINVNISSDSSKFVENSENQLSLSEEEILRLKLL